MPSIGTPYLAMMGRGPFSMKPLGTRRRLLALFVVAIGIVTFFWPTIGTEPPVLETAQWSPFTILWQVHKGNLPDQTLSQTCERCDKPWILLLTTLPIFTGATYLVVFCALLALSVSRSSALLAKISIIGSLVSLYVWRGDWHEFELLFYGDFSYRSFRRIHHVHFGQLALLLVGVMVSLLLISLAEDLDEAI